MEIKNILIVTSIAALVLGGCGGDGGSDPVKAAQTDYCRTTLNKIELCFGDLSNYDLDFNQELAACVDVNCPASTESNWINAEDTVIAMSCNEVEALLELAVSGEAGSGCF
ncbi:MAG: hypothetical protein COV44_10685 [Deltaproteobacteria bacterium CG11_big_fil_rev_8_21_14_0_20_45_16]|nr:MAG: hypothetical protein COV44_10685 [Deltaproteobacteria bacterium CG11_big_fil_rev_8_21_14_0_20_45_16]